MEFLETTIHLILTRTVLYLEEQGHKDIGERFPAISRMIHNVTEEDLKLWSYAEGISKDRYNRLLAMTGDNLQGDHVIESAIDLCLAVLHIPEFAALLQYYTGSGVTLNLAYQLEGISFPSWEDVRQKLDGLSLICPIDRRKSPVKYVELMLDDRVFAFLLGDDLPGEPVSSLCSILSCRSRLHPLYAYEDLAGRAASHLNPASLDLPPKSGDLTQGASLYTDTDFNSRFNSKTLGRIVQLAGTGGRRFLTRHIGRLLGKDMILADLTDWIGLSKDDFTDYSIQFIREALFDDAGICIYGLTEELLKAMGISVQILAKHLILPAVRQCLPLILCTETGFSLSRALEHEEYPKGTVLLLELTPLDYPMRKKVWQGFISQYGLRLDASHNAQRYHLLPCEVSRVLSSLDERGEDDAEDDAPDTSCRFSKLCYQIISQEHKDAPGSSLGCVIYPQARLDDLKVPPSVREDLDYVIASANGSGKIFEEWNLKEKYAYGRAVTALLSGPPGTGKTMGAHAIANALDIPLYQVNLSNIVDKYIGETEKHLEQAFLYAEKTNMVLFFDEADSLFGRRSEVSDAKDRYANTEISYLLQRIEQYAGVVLMATNLMNNIDPAFLRRIKYVIRFQQPDESLRLAIWESCLIPELPADHLDLPYLARQFDFTGGTIKNVLLNACAIAVSEDELLNMRHILKAVKNEYLKMDRIIDTAMWGEYAYLVVP